MLGQFAEVPATGGLAKPQPRLSARGVWCSELVSLSQMHFFMLVISAAVPGEGSWSTTDAFVGGSVEIRVKA